MDDPTKLKRWLHETGRRWLIFDSLDLVDSLSWPDGVKVFMQIVEAYRMHRMGIAIDSADCPRLAGHRRGTICAICADRGTVVTRSKSDVLEVDEMKSAAVDLVNQIREKDPNWNPFKE